MNNEINLSRRPVSIPSSEHVSVLKPTRWMQVERKSPLCSIQKSFYNLQQRSPSSPIEASLMTKSSWTFEKVKALFNAVYESGVCTEEDMEEIRSLSKQVDEETSLLKNKLSFLAVYDQECLKLATLALKELSLLGRQLVFAYPHLDLLEKAMVEVNTRVDLPFFKGEALLGMPFIRKGEEALLELEVQLLALPKGSDTRKRLQELVDEGKKAFYLTVEEWSEDVLKEIQEERGALISQLRKENDQETMRQLFALSRKEKEIVKEITECKSEALKTLLKDALLEIEREVKTCEEVLQNVEDEEPLVYGEEEWLKLVAKRPQTQDPAKGVLWTLTHPESWSETTKAVVHGLFIGMQLSQQAIATKNRLSEVDALRQQIASLPREVSKEVARETALLGTLLFDKYAILMKNPALIEKFSKNPSLQKALQEAFHLFGEEAPSRKEVHQFLDAYQLKQAASSTPLFPTLSLREWWALFTETEEKVETFQGREVQLIASSKHSSWPQTLIATLGEMFSPAKDQTPLSFIETKKEESVVELKDAYEKLEKSEYEPLTHSLKEEIALLQRELIRTSQKTPKDSCSLTELAHWKQEVADKCYAVRKMEEHIARLMEQTKAALSVEDEELDRFGNKHANLVRQARLVEGLKLPGIFVPLPYGISSDAVHHFLKAHAPSLFTEWESLKNSYAIYKGTRFLEEESTKEALTRITGSISEAFEKAGQDEKLFKTLVSEEFITWLDLIFKNGDYLMVRSTGSEDSRQMANAGGNISRAYVSPTREAFCQAAAAVLNSYFGFASLQNRINGNMNPFQQELKLAVTAQQLIGEALDGTTKGPDIPISLVLFTSEPLYVGNENFRTMRISATYGHGEGVVGGLGIATDTALLLISESNPDQLYVLYDNKKKKERLAPMQTPEGIVLKPIPNPSVLQNQPVLTPELLSRLYTWGIVGEKFFDDHPTDMEIVIKKGIIYPVQARPINRPSLLPTYVDRKKISSSAILQEIKGEMLVPGKASIVEIKDQKEICFAPTLAKAESLFIKGQHKVVIVTQNEPANSHPIVNFSALGMPCLTLKDEQLQKMIEKASQDQPIIVCMQTETLFLWDESKQKYQEAISHGFAVHPAKIAISLSTLTEKALDVKEAPQEVKDLLLTIRSATTKEAAEKALNALKNNSFITSLKENEEALLSHSFIPKEALKKVSILSALIQQIETAFKETEATLNRSLEIEKLRPLFHAKVLETLLISKPQVGDSLAQYSVLTVQPFYEEANTLIAYQKKFSHPVHFADLYLLASQAFDPSSSTAWKQFLENLEPLVHSGAISKQEVKQLKEMIHSLKQTGLLQTAFAFFLKDLSSKTPPEALKDVLNLIPPEDQEKISWLSTFQSSLHDTEEKLEAFSNKESFKSAWTQLEALLEKVSLKEGPHCLNTLFENSSPITRLMLLNNLQQLVDLFDRSIKQMKASPSWTEQEKVPLFKEMLTSYFSLLKHTYKEFEHAHSLQPHVSWPFDKYILEMEKVFSELPSNQINQLQASRGFSVAAAQMGAITDFSRHRPKTLEDFFTLIHQNLISLTSNLKNQLLNQELIQTSALPSDFKEILAKMNGRLPPNFSFQQTGFEVSNEEIKVKYNIPLRNHSAQMTLSYDKTTKKTTMEGRLLGEARNRWQESGLISEILSEAHILPMNSNPEIHEGEIRLTWEVSGENQQTLLNEFGQLCEYSLDGNFEGEMNRLISTHGENMVEAMLVKAKKMFIDPNKYVRENALNMFKILIENGKKIEEAIAGLTLALKDSDYWVRDKALLVFKLLIVNEKGIEEAIAEATLALKDPDKWIREKALELFQILVQIKKGIKEGIAAATLALKDPDYLIRLQALTLFVMLVQREKGIEEAFAAAMLALKDPDYLIRHKALELFKELVEMEKGIEEAIDEATLALNDPNYSIRLQALKLFEILIQKDKGIEEPFAAATLALKDPDDEVRLQALKLFERLIQKEKRIEEAIAAATLALKDPYQMIRHKALDLFKELVEKEKGIEEAIDAATLALNDPNISNRIAALKLFEILIQKEKGIEEAIAAATLALKDPNDGVRLQALKLFEILIQKEKGIEEAIAAATLTLKDPDDTFRYRALILFKLLVEKEKGIEEAIAVATLALKDPNKWLRYEALELFEILVKKEKGIEVAFEAANEALNDSKILISEKALSLIGLIKNKDNISSLPRYLRELKEAALRLFWNR